MTILIATLLVSAGIVLLYVGGELLVRGASQLARLAHISPAVIGLTVVSVGTSVPELAVSLFAALGGSPDVAMGNVVGSNIFNVGVIAACAAMLMPLEVRTQTVKLEWPFMFAASLAAIWFASNRIIGRVEGWVSVMALAVFITYIVRLARQEPRAQGDGEECTADEATPATRAMRSAALVVAGIVVLTLGARTLVRGAVTLAELAGVTERVIGLTIVAAGTSLPELAATVVAALRRETDIALGNVLGSNMFNILGILGVVAIVRPIPVAPQIASVDLWWMAGISFLLFPLMYVRRRLTTAEGVLLFVAFGVYMWQLLHGR